MKKMKISLIAGAFMLAGMAGAGYFRDLITDLLKIGGIGLVVDRVGPDINKAINKLQNFSDSQEQMTKVVPILSLGSGKYIGAVQVMGRRDLVSKVKAVVQLETKFAGAVRLKALVPVEAKSVSNVKRVVGVGVSAIVDLKI